MSGELYWTSKYLLSFRIIQVKSLMKQFTVSLLLAKKQTWSHRGQKYHHSELIQVQHMALKCMLTSGKTLQGTKVTRGQIQVKHGTGEHIRVVS